MTTKRTPPKPWKPGESGNPKGRPPGRGLAAELRDAIAKSAPGVIRKLVTQARNGDTAAARLLLERVVPPVKASELETPLNLAGDSLADKGLAVMAAVAAGQIAPGQASQLLGGLADLAKLIETDKLAARIEALEARHAATLEPPRRA